VEGVTIRMDRAGRNNWMKQEKVRLRLGRESPYSHSLPPSPVRLCGKSRQYGVWDIRDIDYLYNGT